MTTGNTLYGIQQQPLHTCSDPYISSPEKGGRCLRQKGHSRRCAAQGEISRDTRGLPGVRGRGAGAYPLPKRRWVRS